MTNSSQEVALGGLMRAAQKGDAAAYRDLLEALAPVLRAYTSGALARMRRPDAASADDLVQEVLLAVHQKRHTYDPALPFLPWLFGIARYKLIDHFRRERRKSQRDVPLDDVEQALASPVMADPATRRDLQRLLADLPERTRRAIELVKLEEWSVAEAAAAVQMSESALKVAVHRALKGLREKLG